MFMQKVRSFLRLTNTELLVVSALSLLILSGSVAAHAYANTAKARVSKLLPAASPTATVTPSSSPSTSPSATPTASATPASVATPTAAPKSSSKAGGSTSPAGSATAPFQIASVMFGAKSVICHDDYLEVVFRDLMVTRHYTTTAGGDATIQIDFSDGQSVPYTVHFPSGGTGVSTLSGLNHVYVVQYPVDLQDLKYRVRLTSPNTLPNDWWSVENDHPTIDPSCSLE